MATTYIENIDNLRPDSWTKKTVADGPTLTNSFLNPTHEKDQILARGIDTINSKLSTYDTKISNVNTRLDTVNENIDLVNADIADVENKLDEIEHETSAKLEKVYVNGQLKGDGTQNNPIGIETSSFPSTSALYGLKKNGQWAEIINGGGGGGPVPTIVGNMGVSAAYVSENNQYVIGLSGTKNLVFESSADTIVFASSAAGKYNFEVNPELVNKWNAGTSAFTNNGFSGIGTSSSRIGVDETGMSTSYKYGWDPNTHKWAYINEGGGSSDNFDVTGDHHTISGDGSIAHPYSVNTDEIATHDWVREQGYIANIETDNTTISGSGTHNDKLGIVGSKVDYWNAHSALSATKLDKSIWDGNSGKFVTSAATDFQTDGQYGIIKDNNGIHWGEIQGGGGISYTFDTTGTGHTLSADGITNPIGVNTDEFYRKTETSGKNQLSTEFATKVDKPNSADSSVQDKYLALRTKANGTVSGWTDILDKVYSKTKANDTFVQKTAVKTGTYGNVTAVSAIGDVPIKDTNLWAITGTYENNNNYQHYIENTNTFNYYTVMVHPANTSSAAGWANDNIIHIILE